MTHDDLVILVQWAEREGYDAAAIVRMVEKPWKWMDELAKAKEQLG
jgi:hypothetical protein